MYMCLDTHHKGMQKALIMKIHCSKISLILVLVLALCIFQIGCQSEAITSVPWQNLVPVPFSGNICEFEGSTILIQIPIFAPGNYKFQWDGIVRASLCGENVTLNCSRFDFSSTTYNNI